MYGSISRYINFLFYSVLIYKVSFSSAVVTESFTICVLLLCVSADNELQTVASIILPGYRVSSDTKDDSFSHKFPFKVCSVAENMFTFFKRNFSVHFCRVV